MMRGFGQVPGIPGLETAPADQVILVLGNQNPNAISCIPGGSGQKDICVGPQEMWDAKEKDARMTGIIMGVAFGAIAGSLFGFWLKGQLAK